jgi:hypothetical protein
MHPKGKKKRSNKHIVERCLQTIASKRLCYNFNFYIQNVHKGS